MHASWPRSLLGLDDDTLIHVFRFLSIRSILTARQVCRRMMHLSRIRTVWHSAYVHEILQAGLPFPYRELTSMDCHELEYAVRRAVSIGEFWLSRSAYPQKVVDFHASSGTGVSEVRFLPGYDSLRVATVSKGIWSVVTIWDIVGQDQTEARKVAQWGPKGIVFTGFIVNSVPGSKAVFAASINGEGRQCIEIIALRQEEIGRFTTHPLRTIQTMFRPVALKGELLAYSDDSSRTMIMDWSSGAAALLRSAEEPVDLHFQYNRCLQVVIADTNVLVVRARSIELFAKPALRIAPVEQLTYRPIASHSFGWVDGVSVSPQMYDWDKGPSRVDPLSILLRAESDDPWSSDVHTLDLYTLEPNPSYALYSGSVPRTDEGLHAWRADIDISTTPVDSPYLFPPVHSTLSSPSVRGILRCTDIVLGPYGTAVWIQPRPARSADLTAFDVHASETQAPETARSQETVAAAVFSGPLQRKHAQLDLSARCVWTQSFGSSNWTSIDYVEELGFIALGSSQGMVTLLRL